MLKMPKMPTVSPVQKMVLGLLAIVAGVALQIKGSDAAAKGYLDHQSRKALPSQPEPPLTLN